MQNDKQWDKYKGEARIDEKTIRRKFKEGDFVFVCTMRDLMSHDVPDELITQILDQIRQSPEAKFLLLTKNPQRYIQLLDRGVTFPKNVVLGATITSNRKHPQMSAAPSNMMRFHYMKQLEKRELKNKRFISVEPILKMDPYQFAKFIAWIKPWAVAVGYDNYDGKLPEPRLEATEKLIELLERVWIVKEERAIEVYRKTIRRAWYEN